MSCLTALRLSAAERQVPEAVRRALNHRGRHVRLSLLLLCITSASGLIQDELENGNILPLKHRFTPTQTMLASSLIRQVQASISAVELQLHGTGMCGSAAPSHAGMRRRCLIVNSSPNAGDFIPSTRSACWHLLKTYVRTRKEGIQLQ
jgi:hypothetical protein